VAAFLLDALDRQGAGLAVVTPEHAARLRAALAARGCDVAGAERAGQLAIADADTTLGKLVAGDGSIDEPRFWATVPATIDRALDAARGGPVAAYGEMVDVLWSRGDGAAALRLEELWNDLSRLRRLSLLCSYHAGHAAVGDPALGPIRAQHSAVV